MKKALSMIISFAFENSDVNRIEAFVEPPNTASHMFPKRSVKCL